VSCNFFNASPINLQLLGKWSDHGGDEPTKWGRDFHGGKATATAGLGEQYRD
jgi:hypothetical protein